MIDLSLEDLEQILYTWLESYDGGQIPNKGDERKLAFIQLFKDLEAKGLTKEEVVRLARQHQHRITKLCYNSNYHNHKKLAIWKDMVERNFKGALALYNPAARGKVTQEDIHAQTPDNSTIELPKTEIKNAPKEHIQESPVQFAPELDISMFDGIQQPDPVYDAEMSKILGFDSDE